MSFQQPVLIIGAGISGLVLAHSLKKQGIPYKVFERDQAQDSRANQGWSISLSFCLPALTEVLDPKHFETIGETAVDPLFPELLEFAYVDAINNEVLVLFDPLSLTNPPRTLRINRKRFRNWLMKGIDVTFNKRLASYKIIEDRDDAGVQVTFSDGTTEQGAVLVGADGVNSAVCRQMMTMANEDSFKKATRLNPARFSVISPWLTEEEFALVRQFSKTHFSAFGKLGRSTNSPETVYLFVSLNDVRPLADKKYQVIFAMSRYDQDNVLPSYENNKDRLLQFKSWVKEGLEGDLQRAALLGDENEEVSDMRIRERPPQQDALSQHYGRVTLIGDAAHTMTMFRGEGGNHAVVDAKLLGDALGEAFHGKRSLTEAIDKYHEEMIPRGIRAVKDSHDAAYASHKEPEIMIKRMQTIVKSCQ